MKATKYCRKISIYWTRKTTKSRKPVLLAPGAKLPAEESLKRRSDEADWNNFVTGGNPTNRPVGGDEKDALEAVIKENIEKGKYKVVPFNFPDSSTSSDPTANSSDEDNT